MRRRYINFLLTYFHNSSKKAHATAACPAVNVNARLQVSSNRPICQARRMPRRPVSSNWPAATPTGHFLSGPSARHVLVRLHHTVNYRVTYTES